MAKKLQSSGVITAPSATLDAVVAFNKFNTLCTDDILPSLAAVAKLKAGRVRIQKLLYAHVVDHFDQLLDTLLLWSSTHVPLAREDILKQLSDQPITAQRVYELFLLGDAANTSIEDELRRIMQQEHVRGNHAGKVSKLASYFGWKDVHTPHRVYTTGKLSTHALATSSVPKHTPTSVVGYAHYLYARRNGINHGDSISFIPKEKADIESKYKVTLPNRFRISAGTVETAVAFYGDLLSQLKGHIDRVVK